MSWIYQLKEFTEDMIPDGAVGFVYQMDVILVDDWSSQNKFSISDGFNVQ